MSIEDPELLADFITESLEHLADVEGDLLAIEAAGDNVDRDLVNKVFRGIHSIKGAAGFLGLATVNKLAHALENILGKMRNGELAPTSSIVEVMLRAADALHSLIDDVQNSNDRDMSGLISALNDAVAVNAAAAMAANGEEPASTEPPTLPEPVATETPVIAMPEQSIAPADPCEAPAAPSIESLQPEPQPAPTQAAVTAAASVEKPAATSSSSATPQVESSIRVHVGVLDRLMNLAGELVLGRNQLVQAIGSKTYAGIDAVAARLDQVTSEVQEAIMKTRMQPIGNVFSKFPRVARDLSGLLGKQCEIIMEGKEVEVDKTIIEAIGDPLTHLVRNSVDHGIELPAERIAKGKKAIGIIRLRAYHQAGKVRIDIIDDGAGIDPAKLRQKALAKGIFNAQQAARMSDREAVNLIFHPGFSTAEKVTDVSGRGVGMDVVRTNVEKLGGSVDVVSTLGAGTAIQITLPLTLAIIPSMIVRSRGERFAIPQVNVLELVRIRTNERAKHIGRVKDAEVLRLRGALLPLLRLDEVLHMQSADEASAPGPVNVIVVESGQLRYGLIVDEIMDSEEIVVKPLGRHVKSSGCLAGATILGDGHVALILDAAGMVDAAHLSHFEEEEASKHEADQKAAIDMQDLLLFSNAPGEHFAIPMSLVTRLERIKAEKIEIVGGQRLLQYRGGALPLVRLEDHIKTQPMVLTRNAFIVVLRAAGREFGLLVPCVDDIRQLAVDIDAETFREKGIAGAFVVNHMPMRLVDVVELAELAHPEWFQRRPEPVEVIQEKCKTTILIAEDSSFFRKQIAAFLESNGYDVVGCEDGAQAWEFLTEEEHQVRLVVTDIEMPRMDGFELCQRIKHHPELGRLPVVALTSLASEADMQRGRDVGVDNYQVKMDRERVLETVAQLLAASGRSHGPKRHVERYSRGECLAV